jgi:hypothetical protein
MPQSPQPPGQIVSRRSFLQQSLTLPVGLLIAACAGPVSTTETGGNTPATPQPSTRVQPTTGSPACDGTPTPSQTEGPYYKAGSPERTSLREACLAGTSLTISGYVLSTTCQPIAHAWPDFWQADSNGHYGTTGFRLCGHQFTEMQRLCRLLGRSLCAVSAFVR